MKLEVGMYVRYEPHYRKGKRLIEKLEEIMPPDKFVKTETYHLENRDVCLKGDIVKASHDIIDLIEVGDYVNGAMVYEIKEECVMIGFKCTILDEDYLTQTVYKNEIKSIVTKEQFEQMQYKVGA